MTAMFWDAFAVCTLGMILLAFALAMGFKAADDEAGRWPE